MNLSCKFRGCLIGSLLGDCLGAPFEGESAAALSVVNSYFQRLADPDLRVPYKKYTDDTAMTKCVAQSLIKRKELDPVDLAKGFVKEFFSDPDRGYGQHVTDVFAALRATKYRDPFAPASIQFDGLGSYGNGAAMRVSPIALFCYSKPFEVIVNMAKQSALLTHTHRNGYNGAILQCLAIHKVLQLQGSTINTLNYLDELILHMRELEKYRDTEEEVNMNPKNEFVFVSALEKIYHLLEKANDVTRSEVEEKLGTDISAHRSVPTAIFAFLKSQTEIDNVKTDNAFQRTIHYAISLGGDTDTIASMAGSIAGAYYGIDMIPDHLQKHCEGTDVIMHLADELFDIVSSTK